MSGKRCYQYSTRSLVLFVTVAFALSLASAIVPITVQAQNAPAPSAAKDTAKTTPPAPGGTASKAVTPSPTKSAAQPEAVGKSPKAEAGVSKLAPGQKVNINSASKEQLEALPGIGPAKAQAIIDGRPYSTPEDIMKVKGIKQGVYGKIKDQFTVK